MPSLDSVPPAAQASGEAQPGGEAPIQPESESQAKVQPDGETPVQPESESQAEPYSKAQAVILKTEERADIEGSVQMGVANPNSATFGSMNARISKYTPRSYIVCGWVDPGNGSGGYQPFVAMYVPAIKRALLIGLGNTKPKARLVRQRCIAERVPLGA